MEIVVEIVSTRHGRKLLSVSGLLDGVSMHFSAFFDDLMFRLGRVSARPMVGCFEEGVYRF